MRHRHLHQFIIVFFVTDNFLIQECIIGICIRYLDYKGCVEYNIGLIYSVFENSSADIPKEVKCQHFKDIFSGINL